jgi:hypothetical protein
MKKKLLFLPLCSLPFTCSPVNSTIIKNIKRDLKILAFIHFEKKLGLIKSCKYQIFRDLKFSVDCGNFIFKEDLKISKKV